MSTQSAVATWPWTQPWPSVASWAGTSSWPQMVGLATHNRIFLFTLTSPVLPLFKITQPTVSHLFLPFVHRILDYSGSGRWPVSDAFLFPP